MNASDQLPCAAQDDRRGGEAMRGRHIFAPGCRFRDPEVRDMVARHDDLPHVSQSFQERGV